MYAQLIALTWFMKPCAPHVVLSLLWVAMLNHKSSLKLFSCSFINNLLFDTPACIFCNIMSPLDNILGLYVWNMSEVSMYWSLSIYLINLI